MKRKQISYIVALTALCIALPACKKKVSPVATAPIHDHKEYLNLPANENDRENTLVFDDAAEELILEDDDIDYGTEHSPSRTMLAENKTSGSSDNNLFGEEPHLEFEETQDNQPTAVVYFPYDQETPTPDQEENLRLAMTKAREIVASGKKVVCKGHACDWGRKCRVRNMPLSMKRSEWVADYLAKNGGISSDAVKVFGVGSEEPVSFEHTKDGQSPNRRVEIYALAA